MPDLSWELFERQVAQCQMCGLCQNIHHKVPGQGDHHSPLMLIGEGPGQVEDEEGLAFVGPAGQLLTKMLAAISLPRDRVYICNVVKCRPPQNRVPTDEEAAACKLHLRIQTALIRPESHRPARLNRREKHYWGGHPHHPRPRQVVRAQRHLDDGDVSPVGAPARPV